jgi:hypothetical protein
MKTIVAGGRYFTDALLLSRVLDEWMLSLTTQLTIVSGTANGADKCGEQWATTNAVKIKRFPAKWDEYGKSAGYRRNAEMAGYAEALIAFWDGKSKGTKHMIDIALDKGLIVKVVRYEF